LDRLLSKYTQAQHSPRSVDVLDLAYVFLRIAIAEEQAELLETSSAVWGAVDSTAEADHKP
jgi:hypothetical protein